MMAGAPIELVRASDLRGQLRRALGDPRLGLHRDAVQVGADLARLGIESSDLLLALPSLILVGGALGRRDRLPGFSLAGSVRFQPRRGQHLQRRKLGQFGAIRIGGLDATRERLALSLRLLHRGGGAGVPRFHVV